MKKIFLLFFMIISTAFSLEITSIDPLNFNPAVQGDKEAYLTDIGVYVKGEPGKRVEIIVPEIFITKGNKMEIEVKEKSVLLDSDGNGKFKMDVKLHVEKIEVYKTLTDKLSIRVKYLK
ncbi:MAG: hypothetical protein KAH04_05720 [Psychrilyobacter sp.]|nr:hypothetical protein [Psychrilyobacter sp.]